MSAKLKTNWDAMEPFYLAGVVPVEELCTQFNTTKGRISQVAKKRGWKRNLDQKIYLATQAKLNRAVVVAETKQQKEVSEAVAVDAVAKTNSELILKHRTDIGNYQHVCEGLLTEFSAQAMSEDELMAIASLHALIESQGEVDPVDVSKQITAFKKVLRLGSRVDVFRQLVEAKTKLVALERQAFGIKDDAQKEKSQVNFVLNMFGVAGGTSAVQLNVNQDETDR